MSANNAIFINTKTYEVYHHGCADNEFKPKDADLIGEGESLEEAIKFASDFQGEYIVEYGVHFFS